MGSPGLQRHEQTEGGVWVPECGEVYGTAIDANLVRYPPSTRPMDVSPSGRPSTVGPPQCAQLGDEEMWSLSRAPLASPPSPAFATTAWPGVLGAGSSGSAQGPANLHASSGLRAWSSPYPTDKQAPLHSLGLRRLSMSSCSPVSLVHLPLSVLYPTCEGNHMVLDVLHLMYFTQHDILRVLHVVASAVFPLVSWLSSVPLCIWTHPL